MTRVITAVLRMTRVGPAPTEGCHGTAGARALPSGRVVAERTVEVQVLTQFHPLILSKCHVN